MNEIKIFSNALFGDVRVARVDNIPMFCLADVCKSLDIKNVGDCKSRLKQEGIATTDTLTNGGLQKTTYISEQNGQEYPMFIMNKDGFSLINYYDAT